MALLPFAQLDLAGAPAVADGRYLVRPELEPESRPDVLVVRTLGAARSRSRLRRGRPVAVGEGDAAPTPLQLSRITLIKSIPFDDEGSASEWLERVSGEEEIARGLTEEVAQVCNRALLAQRVAAPDPYAADIRPADAVVVRFGYGTGEEVADGRWQAASELAEHTRQSFRAQVIDSVGAQERIAGVLGGRDEIAPHEALLIDAERNAAQGRGAIAALMLAAALDSLAHSGGDPNEASDAVAPLREAALGSSDVDARALKKALKLGRRAIRATSGG